MQLTLCNIPITYENLVYGSITDVRRKIDYAVNDTEMSLKT